MSLAAGRAAAAEGMAAAVAAADEHWREVARYAIEDLAHETESFTSDDIWAKIELMDPTASTSNPKAIGGIVRAAITRGEIVRVGFEQSTRKSRHAGWIARYRAAKR